MKSTPHFLNVDLELRSSSSPSLVIQAFGDAIHLLYNGPCEGPNSTQLTTFEVEIEGENGPENKIAKLCFLIEKLSENASKEWLACHSRRFDIGIQIEHFEETFSTILSRQTIERCAALGCEIAFTIYPIKTQ